MKRLLLIICFLFAINSNSFANEKIWEYEKKYLTEECFVHKSVSGKNFKEFYDRYSPQVLKAYGSQYSDMNIKQKENDFFKFIGKYYVDYIPVGEKFEVSWGSEKLSLTRNLDECVKNNVFEIDKTKNYYEIVSNPTLKLWKELKMKCLFLAPSISSKAKCLDIKTIKHTQPVSGKPPYSQIIDFGIYDYNEKKIILPLSFNISLPTSAKDLFEIINQTEKPKRLLKKDFKKLLSEEINSLSIYLGQSKNNKKIPLVDMFYSNLNGNAYKTKEVSVNDDDYFIVSGCRRQSCGEKALLWIDKKNKIVVGAMIHYFLDTKENSKDENYLLIFSKKFDKYKDLPDVYKSALSSWLSGLTEYDIATKKNIPLITSIKNFINSENNRIEIIENEK